MKVKFRNFLRNRLQKGTPLFSALEFCHDYLWKRFPSIFSWGINKTRIEIDLTSQCTLKCFNCNRAVKHAPSSEIILPEQIGRFMNQSIELNWKWKLIVLIGGEPTLHPHIFDILDILKPYKTSFPGSVIAVATNGYGRHVNDVLANLPAWVYIANSKKTTHINSFQSYNDAPIDARNYQGEDFSRGCRLVEICGLSLTRHGLYCCGPGANVDRVFGFDVGIKKLADLDDKNLKTQLALLCKYCGHYKYNYAEKEISVEKISPSWQVAFEKYNKCKPRLSLY